MKNFGKWFLENNFLLNNKGLGLSNFAFEIVFKCVLKIHLV
jgi:hypothetical protein